MELTEQLLLENSATFIANFNKRMAAFFGTRKADEAYYIDKQYDLWKKALVISKDADSVEDAMSKILGFRVDPFKMYEIDVFTLYSEAKAKFEFLSQKKQSALSPISTVQYSHQAPSITTSDGVLDHSKSAINNLETYFPRPNPPQSTTNSPLKFFWYLLEAGGFEEVKDIFWVSAEKFERHIGNIHAYDPDNLTFKTLEINQDTGDFESFTDDRKKPIMKLLQDKISISKGLIDEKISSCQNREEVSFFLNRMLDKLMLYDEKYRNHPLTLRHKFTIDIFTSFLEDIVKKYKSSIDDAKKEEIADYSASLLKVYKDKDDSKSQKNFNDIFQKDLHEFMSQHQWESFIKALINIDILDSNGNQTEEQLPLYKTIYCLKVQLKENGYLKESTKQLPAKVIASVHSKIFPSGKEAKIPKINQGHKLTEKQLENIFDLPVYEDPQKK